MRQNGLNKNMPGRQDNENFGNASFNYSTSVNSLSESLLNQVVKISPNPYVGSIK